MSVSPVPEGFHTISPYIVVKDAARAIEFYQQAFGATVVLRINRPDGRIMHSELKIGDSMLMLADETGTAPQGSPITLFMYVDDARAVAERAVAAGATLIDEIVDHPDEGDRRGGVKDPFGITWWLGTHYLDVSREQMQKHFDALNTKGAK